MDNWSLGGWHNHALSIHTPDNSRPRPGLDSTTLARGAPRGVSVLSQVHTVLLIDDSASMTESGSTKPYPWGSEHTTSWEQVHKLLSVVAPLITRHDPQGMDLFFVNHSNPRQGLQSNQDVQSIFSQVRPEGHAELGLRVNSILDAYTCTLRYERTLKPLNLVVVTDGKFDDEHVLLKALEEHVSDSVQRGQPAHQMRIEILQTGDCERATEYFAQLRQHVCQHGVLPGRDVVGVTALSSLQRVDATGDCEWH